MNTSKKMWAINQLVSNAAEKKGKYLYVSLMQNKVVWEQLKIASAGLQKNKPNESDLSIELLNGSRIELEYVEMDEHKNNIAL